jgi:hypothetical protein
VVVIGQERPTPAGTAQSPAVVLTSATENGTGEREAMRRACCTSEAVPTPPGNATTSTEGIETGEVWATALGNGLLEQLPITDRPSGPAMPLPPGWHHHGRPAEQMGSAANGGIGTTGPAMEQQMHQPAATAGQQLSGHALIRPGQITAAPGRDHQRAGRNYLRPRLNT